MRLTKTTVVLARLAATVLVLGGALGAASAGDDVPMKGSATATYESFDPVTKRSHFTLEGVSTHLGLLSGDSYVQWVMVPVPHPVGGVSTLVAANGDELVLATTTATQTYLITGGTGRFAGATGSGSFIATGSGEVSLVWDGTIDFKKK